MFFDATDNRTAAWSSPSSSCSAAACRPRRPQQEEGGAALVVLQLGRRSPASPRSSRRCRRSTRCSRSDGTPIRATCSVILEEMPGEPGGQNPTSGCAGRARVAHRGRRATRWPRSRTASTATRRCGGRSPRPTTSTTRMRVRARQRRCSLPAADELGRAVAERMVASRSATGSSSRSTAHPLADDVEALLVVGYVDDSQQPAGHVRAALPRPEPAGAVQGRREDRLEGQDRASRPPTATQPGAADHRRGHRAGGRVRRHRHVHRDPRLRQGAPALPRPADRDLHADDRLRHRDARSRSGPACTSARCESTSTVFDHVSPGRA